MAHAATTGRRLLDNGPRGAATSPAMRRSVVLLAAIALLAGCGSAEPQQQAAAMTTSAGAPASRSTSTPSPTQDTPEQQFTLAMQGAGIVPQLASASAAIDLALAICVAHGSGKTSTEIMASLASGSMSLGQMMDLEQAATQFYCPKFYVPSS